MKPSSPPSSPSVTAGLRASSSSPPHPRLSLQSAELQAEFLHERRNKLGSCSDFSESSVFSSDAPPSSPLPSPFSPTPSSSSPCSDQDRQARLSLSSPELLSELRESRTRPLRHVPAHNGLTTVFSGRGRGGQASGRTVSTPPANQRTSY